MGDGPAPPSGRERLTLPLVLVLVAAVTVALRVVPGLIWPSRGMDAGAHLLLRRHIRTHGMRLTMQDWPLVLDERHTYPWAYHWLLALLPESWLHRVPPLPTAICDTAHALVIVLLAAHVAPHVEPAIVPAVAGLGAGLLFATAPALLVVGFGPRAYEVTPRPFGELVFTVLVIGALLYLVEGRPAGLLVAAGAGGLLLLSSKFAAQVLLFTVPLMALLMRDARILLLLPVALAVALAASAGGYWWILRTQILHLSHYRRRVQYDHPALASRNRGRALLGAFARCLRVPQDPAARMNLARLAEGHTLLQFVLRNVLWIGVVAFAAAGVFGEWTALGNGWKAWLCAWAVAPIGPFLLTSLKHFRFLGEAERYPEYGLTPVAVLGAIGLVLLPGGLRTGLLALYVLTAVPAFVYTVARLRWNHRRLTAPELDQLACYLASAPEGAIVVPLPWHLAFHLAPDVSVRFVAAMDAGVWCRDYDEIFAIYPWILPDVARWQERWGASLVVVDRSAMSSDEVPMYDFGGFELLFDTGRYQVFGWRT